MSSQSILGPVQTEFLEQFFQNAVGQQFFLTGGTALAAFYLEHRYSEDLDLFTLDTDALARIQPEVESIAIALGATAKTTVATPMFRQLFIVRGDESLKIDLVRDIDVQFGQHSRFGSIIVDAFENIGANKVTAIFGRTAAKDFVDLYFIVQSGVNLDDLIEMAKQKDGGLTEFYLAGMVRQVREVNRLPRMLKPLDLGAMKQFYLELADELLRRAKPPA
ncbi:MAG: nucleotidyl transferase AbiEii/AbiGii toxin family protein [Chloroflexi bacterium]|nr:nucleotidyl transferase AbiEii/AbiGii toxin family protein [Chloroflexota bacterium]